MRGFFLYLDTIKELFYFWNKSNVKKGGSILIFHKYCMFCTLFSIQHPFTHTYIVPKKIFNFIFCMICRKLLNFSLCQKMICNCNFWENLHIFLMFSLKKNIANYSQRLFFFYRIHPSTIFQPFFLKKIFSKVNIENQLRAERIVCNWAKFTLH